MMYVIQLTLQLNRRKVKVYSTVGLLYDTLLCQQGEIAVGRGLTEELYARLLLAEELLEAQEAITMWINLEHNTELCHRQLETRKALCLEQKELYWRCFFLHFFG